ncbi:MAG: restriction endonuclease [Acidobacteriota bacterium]
MSQSRGDLAKLLGQIAKDRNLIEQISAPQFESVVAELISHRGAAIEAVERIRPAVELVVSVHDQLLVSMRDNLGAFQRFVVECKNALRPIEATAVEALRATVEATNAVRGMLVTSSAFTAQARRVAEDFQSTIQLIDGNALAEWIRQYQADQEAFAASLAYRFERLRLTELDRIVWPDSVDEEAVDPSTLSIDADYKDRIVRVDHLPFRVFAEILREPRRMRDLSPRQFEAFVAEILDQLGFRDVILTPRSGDGGRDVIAAKEVNGIPLTFYFECKKYAENNKVQLATLRALLGVVAHESRSANIGVLVTTSEFTRGSQNLIINECRLDGKDYNGILGWIADLKTPSPI